MPLSSKYLELRKESTPDLHNNDLLRACQKDKDLLDELLLENKEFIFLIVSRRKGNVLRIMERFGVTEEEILQHGFIGMLTAIRGFDPDRGYKFTTYACRPILWEINHLLYSSSRIVKLSRNAVNLIKRMDEVERRLGFTPTVEEFSEELNVPAKRIREVLRFSTDLVYLDAMENSDLFAVDEFLEDATENLHIVELIEQAELDEFETKVINFKMDGLNNSKIAELLDVFPMIINRTLVKIKDKLEDRYVDGRLSKYEEEIKLFAEEMEERGDLIQVDDMKDILSLCGYDIEEYTSRILYYIRQKSLKRLEDESNQLN